MPDRKPGPYKVEFEEGKRYFCCMCGQSKTPPICDGSHKGTGKMPKRVDAEKTETVYLCGCGHTKTPPFCDNSHKQL